MSFSTVALVLRGFIDALKIRYPDLRYVYDENLSYQSSLEYLRKKHVIQSETDVAFPLFSFRRSVLHPSKQQPIAVNIVAMDLSPTEYANFFKASHGTIDVEFLVFHPGLDYMESFEIDYLGYDGIKSIRSYNINIPGVSNDWSYLTYFGDLESLTINVQKQYFKGLKGMVHISGWFFAINDPQTYPKIKEIMFTIKDFREGVALADQVVFEQDLITAADLP